MNEVNQEILLTEIRILEHQLESMEANLQQQFRNNLKSKTRLHVENLNGLLDNQELDTETKLRRISINCRKLLRALEN
jgi:hypothetical protein